MAKMSVGLLVALMALSSCVGQGDVDTSVSGAADRWADNAWAESSAQFQPLTVGVVLSCITSNDGSAHFERSGDAASLSADESIALNLLENTTAFFPEGFAASLSGTTDEAVLVSEHIGFRQTGLDRCSGILSTAITELGDSSELGPQLALLASLLDRGGFFSSGTLAISLQITSQSECRMLKPTITVSAANRDTVDLTPYHSPCRYDHAHVRVRVMPSADDCGNRREQVREADMRKAAIICYPKNFRVSQAGAANTAIDGHRGSNCALAPHDRTGMPLAHNIAAYYLPYAATGNTLRHVGGPNAANGDLVFQTVDAGYSVLTDDDFTWTQIASRMGSTYTAESAQALVHQQLLLSRATFSRAGAFISECVVSTRE